MINSSCDLDYAVVAFVDILGFSDMVRSDCENKNGSLKFFEILKNIQILSEYQYKLLCNSIICRGAMAYGKHYTESDFMFSQALIEAYQLECMEAKYPRIIISP